MSKQVFPAETVTFGTCSYPAAPAERSFRGETADQYAAKHIALFLINLEVDFSIHHFGPEWNFGFRVPETEVPAIERFLASIPTARPSSDELLAAHLYAGADAGCLDLAQSGHAVAQVASQGDTQYLADMWNAFAPGNQSESLIPIPEPAPVPSIPVSELV